MRHPGRVHRVDHGRPGRAGAQPPVAGLIGMPVQDGRHWHLYSGPVDAPAAGQVWVCAWRLGHAPSEDVHVSLS